MELLTFLAQGPEGSGRSFVIQLLDHQYGGWMIIGAGIVVISAIKGVVNIVRSTSRERTRREIAAFIAEGSMTPEQGERLMKAGEGSQSC